MLHCAKANSASRHYLKILLLISWVLGLILRNIFTTQTEFKPFLWFSSHGALNLCCFVCVGARNLVYFLSLQHLKDTFPQPAGVDLAPDVMQFMYHLCLAQAQECILEKSMMDNRKATIIGECHRS